MMLDPYTILMDTWNTISLMVTWMLLKVSLPIPSTSNHCQTNVGSPMNYSKLVIQLDSDLTETYKGVSTLIRQHVPLPQFIRPIRCSS